MFGNKKKVMKFAEQVSAGMQLIMIGLYGKLREKFSKKYKDKAKFMAAAVGNNVFALEATTIEAKEFAKKNKERIEQETKDLLEKDAEAREIIVLALRMLSVVDYMGTKRIGTEETRKKYTDILMKYGKDYPEKPPLPIEFLEKATEFYGKYAKEENGDK